MCCRNLNYWDSVSTLAGEVPLAQKLFPRAIGSAVILVVLTYLLPLIAGLGVMGTVQEWKTGYFTVVAKQVPCPPHPTAIWQGAADPAEAGSDQNRMSSCNHEQEVCGRTGGQGLADLWLARGCPCSCCGFLTLYGVQ